MNWNMFGGPQQQGLRMPNQMPGGYAPAQQGLRMPPQMPGAVVPPQQGFQVPAGLADKMNAPLQPNISGGMNPMAMMQLMNMGMKMGDQGQSQQQPMQPAFRMPTPDLTPYRRFSLFGR
jgi:hypothetical protein